MILAYDFPLLGLFWSMLWLFLWIAWLFLLFRVISDIFRDGDLGGFAKAIWLIVVIVAPYLGVLIYVIARGHGMSQRDLERARANEAAFAEYVRHAAGTNGGGGASVADELAKLADLRDRGVVSDEEFAAQKARLLA